MGKKEKKSILSAFLPLVNKFLKIADEAIRTDKEIRYIGKLKLPFGAKTANTMYQISFKPLKRKK